MVDDVVLNRLVENFEDFKEMIIRIDENVKGLNTLKNDVDTLKIELAQEKESTKSAHKRIDALETKEKEREKDIKWMKQQIIVGLIMFIVTVLAGVVVFVVTK